MTDINARQIVLDLIATNEQASLSYTHDPAFRHGVEIVIGVLGRAGPILLEFGKTPDQAHEIVRRIAVACSMRPGGQEDRDTLARLNTHLFGNGQTVSGSTVGGKTVQVNGHIGDLKL